MPTNGLDALREALIQLVRRPAGAPDAAACLDRIEALTKELEPSLDPHLKHVLGNRSYVKALAALEGGPATHVMRAVIGGRLLELTQGDLTLETTEAIANAANEELAGGGGVDGAIHRAGGPAIMAELRERYQGCPTGSAVITGGGKLAAKYVIHAVGPVYAGDPADADLLASAYRTCLVLCEQHRIASIAFPSISTGVYGYPLAEAAPVALAAVADHLSRRPFPTLARFVLFDGRTFEAYHQAMHALGFDHGH